MFCLQVQLANNEALSLHGKIYHEKYVALRDGVPVLYCAEIVAVLK
jgi:hypothetical protein